MEGRPYWINLKQGWLYEFSPWHHDATHSPLLPLLYAIFFLLFGTHISAANIIVSLAAGLLAFPLLRLSRSLTGTCAAGLLIYLWLVFNSHNDFLFEVFSGLSIPATVTALAFSLLFFWQVIVRRERCYIVGGAISLACYFYIRPGEQLIFIGFLVCSLFLGWFYLRRRAFMRLTAMWSGALLLVLPWLGRNILIFGNPFFTHMTSMLWTDRAYDYWGYHELIPLPTPASFFASHSIADFLWKIVANAKNYTAILNQTLNGQLVAFALVLTVAIIVVSGVRNRLKRYFLYMGLTLLLGYSLLHSLVPVADKRYMIMPLFCAYVVVVLAALITGNKRRAIRWFSLATVVGLFAVAQWNFWVNDFATQLKFTYTNSDQQLREDRTIRELKQRFGPDDVLLGPIAEVQRLNFATGLTFIEAPDNLAELRDPPAFFRRYRIRYSLTDVSRILPEEMIEKMEVIGNRPLFHIRLDEGSCEGCGGAKAASVRKSPSSKGEVAAGISNRLVFVDTYHGAPTPNEEWLIRLGNRVTSGAGDLLVNKERLFRSGLFVLRYAMHKPEFDEREFALVEQFISQGGRVLLLCPAWVPVSYEGKSLQGLGCNRIAQMFRTMATSSAVAPPFRIEAGFTGTEGALVLDGAPAFSRVSGLSGTMPIISDQQGNPVAIAARQESARLVLWGHNNMFNGEVVGRPEGRLLVERILAWLWAND